MSNGPDQWNLNLFVRLPTGLRLPHLRILSFGRVTCTGKALLRFLLSHKGTLNSVCLNEVWINQAPGSLFSGRCTTSLDVSRSILLDAKRHWPVGAVPWSSDALETENPPGGGPSV
ncbi:hypothetical protein B0T14DRAFT_527388 [Immersiella caudata]|uniref:Uncharacterized protein n=1 Tax=Immersiella caudata TaxID=314043 RepID=A0AA39WEM6_9PEZI|nr:hypothetical protein B0T14DRAFT_527388 [Immersiella caudata]